MKDEKQQSKRVHVRACDEQADVFVVVVTDKSEPGALPVIPTAKALSYWGYPCHGKAAAS